MALNFRRKLLNRGAILLSLLIFGVSSTAIADPISYRFDGRITHERTRANNSAWQFKEGQRFRGNLVYDVDAISSFNTFSDTAELQWKQYYSPVVSITVEIDLGNNIYKLDVPLGKSVSNVFIDSGNDLYGARIDARNNNLDGSPIISVSDKEMIGDWYPTLFFTYLIGMTPVIDNTEPNIDLVKLFNDIPEERDRGFNLRFADPNGWTDNKERIDGTIIGQFENFTLQSGVPEPQIWAMLIAGFGAIGASLRRRSVTREALPI